jgi:hypothetical protein
MKFFLSMRSRSFIIGHIICLTHLLWACATFEKPVTTINEQIRERALTKESSGVRVSAAVVGTEEARATFGIDLLQNNIQAVWLEIENNTNHTLILLPTSLDPDYFAPLEVAYAYHKTYASDVNAAIDEHLQTLNFPIRSPILPGSNLSGYVFTNRTIGMKVIDIDLLGRNFSQNFTFFVPDPDKEEGQRILERMKTMFSARELKTVENEAALRQALEHLPCCVSDEDGTPSGEPLNVVIIGEIEDWIPGFVRRGYQYQPLNPRYVFGRPQEISGQKKSRGYTRSQEHFIRIWKTPILYNDKPVWIAQTSTCLGGRFTEKAPAEVTGPLDPYVDHTRYDLTQDLAYSQALIKIGYVKGSGRSQPTQANARPIGAAHYITDGLRVVLVFAQRPASLADIDFFDWERLVDYH